MLPKTSGKGPWSFDEDNVLQEWVKSNGAQKWSLCSETIPGRSGKQCRERWFNNLNPNVKKGNWTAEEDDNIFQGYLQHGSSWSRIAKHLEGRTENSVKNRFYSTVRKLLSDSEKQTGKSSEQQIRSIIEMSLGKKIGAGIPLNEESVKNTPSDSHNNLDDDNNNEDDENDEKSLNQSQSVISKHVKTSENPSLSLNDGSSQPHVSKIAPPQHPCENTETINEDESIIQEERPDVLQEMKIEDKQFTNIPLKLTSKKKNHPLPSSSGPIFKEQHEDQLKGNCNEETSSEQSSSSSSSQQQSQSQSSQQQHQQSTNLMKRKYNRKRHQNEYSESNLLYRLLKSNDVTIKNTKCLQDYSVFYRKYKQNKYIMKKKKKEDDLKQHFSSGAQSSSPSFSSFKDPIEDEQEGSNNNNHQLKHQKTEQKEDFSNKKSPFEPTNEEKTTKKPQKKQENITNFPNQQVLYPNHKEEHQTQPSQSAMINTNKSQKSNSKTKVKHEQTTIDNIHNQGNTKSTYKSITTRLDNHQNQIQNNETVSCSDAMNNDYSNGSIQNNDNDYDVNTSSHIQNNNQLENFGQIESQLLKYFQKSMGQFFKSFIKKSTVIAKETESERKQHQFKQKNNNKSTNPPLLPESQQPPLSSFTPNPPQLLSLTNSQKNIQDSFQRTNTIIQNPPSTKHTSNNKKTHTTSSQDMYFEQQIHKQQQLSLQQINQDLLSYSQDTPPQMYQSHLNPHNIHNSTLLNQHHSMNIQSSKSSFQLNKNQNAPSSRGGHTNQITSSSSLFSQPHNVNNNTSNSHNALISPSHLTQHQQVLTTSLIPINTSITTTTAATATSTTTTSETTAQSLNINNLKNMLNQNLLTQLDVHTSLPSNVDSGVDQKMVFLLNQLNTLESMLCNTKKELVKLEASLNSRTTDTNNNNHVLSYANNSIHPPNNNNNNNNNTLFGQNNFYPYENGQPPTAHVLNTLPSFGSHTGFEKSENGNPSYTKRKNSKDNTSQFSDFDKFINNNS